MELFEKSNMDVFAASFMQFLVSKLIENFCFGKYIYYIFIAYDKIDRIN